MKQNQEIFVIEMKSKLADGRESFQLCGSFYTRDAAEAAYRRMPHPEHCSFEIVRYVPDGGSLVENGKEK